MKTSTNTDTSSLRPLSVADLKAVVGGGLSAVSGGSSKGQGSSSGSGSTKGQSSGGSSGKR